MLPCLYCGRDCHDETYDYFRAGVGDEITHGQCAACLSMPDGPPKQASDDADAPVVVGGLDAANPSGRILALHSLP